MNHKITIESLENIPHIENGHNLESIISEAITGSGLLLQENDILCVASKVVSITENRKLKLSNIKVSETATKIHEKIARKDPRTIQVIIDQTGKNDDSRLEINGSYIGGWLPNGLRLTSFGVDKIDEDTVILLPENPDESAKRIGQHILAVTGTNVGVIITDSDGRVDKKGATQLAIGIYGIPPLRVSESVSDDGKLSRSEETLCDMLAASAALIMGQRGTNKPVVLIRGVEYKFNPSAQITDALNEIK